MQERINLVGGTIAIQSDKSGTSIEINVPMES